MINKIRIWFLLLTEFIAAMALAAIFIIFLLQIFTRYAPKISWIVPLPFISSWMNNLEPIGWTVNLISLLWVWIIFFGCAFFVRDREHVVFDILFFAVSKKFQKIFSFIIALFLASIMLYSFGPTWDAVFDNRLMELKKIQTLKMPVTGERIPIKWLFAPYIILMVAVILRYFWNILSLLFIEKRMERSKIGEDN